MASLAAFDGTRGVYFDGLLPAAHAEWRRLLNAVDGVSGGTEAIAFVRSLRPAWWLLRAWVLTLVVAALLQDGRTDGVPFPRLGVLGPLGGFALFAALSVGSVWLAHRASSSGPARTTSFVGNVLVVPVLLLVPSFSSTSAARVYDEQPSTSTLQNQDGRGISQIYPFDSTGKPLKDVYLYDQDGSAITNLQEAPCPPAQNSPGNVFPRTLGRLDELTVTCTEGSTDAPFSVAIPRAVPSASAVPGASATPSVPASAAPSASAEPSAVATASIPPAATQP